MKAKQLDRKFDEGEDLAKHLDLTQARRPGQEQPRRNEREGDHRSEG